MERFRYRRVADEEAAASAAGEGRAFLGGGTTLIDLMKLGIERPTELVDIGRLPGSPQAEPAALVAEGADGGLRIAGAARNSDVAAHPLVRKRYPALSEALLAGASPQIRNMATVAGNLLQRTRCAYFRDIGVEACNKRAPGSGCAARSPDAWSRMHAILGGSEHCIAVHPSDMCVALTALDAVVHTRGPRGPRALPVGELHTSPGDHPEIETVLGPGELITHVTLPPSPFAARSCYVKVRDRASFSFALASAAVALEVPAVGAVQIRSARVALGGVAPRPWRSRPVEDLLVGHAPSRALFERAAARAVTEARSTPRNDFKIVLIQRTIVRALERASGVAA